MIGFKGRGRGGGRGVRRRRKRRTGGVGMFSAIAVGAIRGVLGLRLLRYVWVAPVLAGAVWGIGRLEAYLLGRPSFLAAPKVRLADVPAGLEERILAVIDPVVQVPWSAPDLCRDIGQALERSAWVKRVRQVRRYADGSVVVSADYRVPAALVQVGGDFYLVSDDGVRLPGRYGYHASLVVVQGTAALPPEAGQRWPGTDVGAALAIIRLLRDLPFFDQITGVLVDNCEGRRDKREPHILLATAPSGNRIVWGSAPGREIEENFPEEKIQILLENYRQWGRIDAGHEMIDISVFPDRFTAPVRT